MLKKAAEYRSEFRLVILITVSVFIIEAFVGIVLSFLPSYSIWYHELIDAVLLVILLSPILYFLCFRPMVRNIEKCRQLEGELQKERNYLEDLVNERTAELSAANDKLKQEIIEHKIAEDLLQERTVDLDDRIREIQCLYRIAKFMEEPDRSWQELVQMTVDLIPFAWLDPGNLGIQVALDGRELKTKNFKKTGLKHVDYITVDGEQIGTITVCCLAGKASSQDSIFLNQRHQLIANVAEQIGIMVQRRRTQAALRDSERTYRTVAENLHEGIWFIDQDEHTTYVNPRMADMLGYTVDEMTGQRLFAFMDERGVELCERNLERRKQGIKEQHDFELLRKDGERIYTSMETTPVTDAAGNYIGALASVADITERKNIELELQQRTRELGERVKELNCLYGISNLVNKPGISLPEILQGIVNLIPHSWQYPAIACAAITLEDQEYTSDNFTETKWVQSCKIRVHGKLVGSLKVFYLENKPEIDEGPFMKEERKLIEAIAVNLGRSIEKIRVEEELQKAKVYLEKRVEERTSEIALANKTLKGEIEERKLAEQRLQQNRTMLQAVFDGIADPLVLVDGNLVVKIINQAAAEYYEIGDNQDAVGMVFWEAAQKSDIFKNCEMPSAVLNNQVLSLERKGFRAPDRLERVFIYPVKEKKGGVGDAIVHLTDITEERRIEKQLIQSEKMASLGILVTSIAHEINNPNSFITFNIPILEEYIETLMPFADEYAANHPDLELFNMSYPEFRADVVKLLKNIEHGSERISAFVSNLREFAQFDGRKPKKWVDLKSVIEKVLSICGSNIKKKVKSFNFQIPDDFPTIFTDPSVLEQVLLNLLVNASQAADKKKSWVKLSAASGDNWRDHTIIEISDNGSGMDEDTKRHIFNPFFTTKSSADGTGLGLYVCHNLIQGIGGYIEAESEPGKGSTFRVILPDKDYRKQPR